MLWQTFIRQACWFTAVLLASTWAGVVDACAMEVGTDREALREGWKQAAQCGKWDFTLKVQDVAVNGHIAVERGKYTLKFSAGPEAPPGLVSYEDKGNYVVFWRMESDKQWRVVWDAPVSELPLP